jgi:HlyD family secretion protein
MNWKVRVVVLAVVLILGVLGWWLLRAEEGVARGIRASGTVEATEVRLGFQMSGRIESIELQEGESARAGAVLALLAREGLEADIGALQAGVDQARAQLDEMEQGPRPQEVARAEAGVQAAREVLDDRLRNAERTARLHEGGAVSREAMEKANTAARVARSELDQLLEALELVREGARPEQRAAQRARVRQAEAALERAEVGLGDAILTAPRNGLVAVRHREPGEIVAAGSPVLTLRDLDDRWVRIYVAGDLVGRVRIGQRAEIRGDADPDRRYAGEVAFIGSEAEFTPRNVQTTEQRVRLVYPVRVRITGDPDADLKPGLPVDVILLEEEEAAVASSGASGDP